MKLKHIITAVPTAFLVLGCCVAIAGKTLNEAGVLVCVNDKWQEKELEKGHKLVDYAGRCVGVPDDPKAEKYSEDCVGKYEYMPDKSWKGSGTCTRTHTGGDKSYDTFEESSQLKEYPYKVTGGTGKFKGASGGGTYAYESMAADTLFGGRYKGKVKLP